MSNKMKAKINDLRNDMLKLSATDDAEARMSILKRMQSNLATVENELGRLEHLSHRLQLRIGVMSKLLPNDAKEALK